MKNIIIRNSAVLLSVVVAAVAMNGCDWDVNGVDRMSALYPEEDVVDSEVSAADASENDATADTALSDLSENDAKSDSVEIDPNVWPDVSYENLEGLWAVRLVSNGIMNVPIIGEKPMTTKDLFLAAATSDWIQLTFCDELIFV